MAELTTATGELWARAAQGDPQAFAQAVDLCAGALEVFLARRGAGVLGADFGVEDALQLVLHRAWTLAPRFEYRGTRALHAWLVSIAHAVLLDRRKYALAARRSGARSLDETKDGLALAAEIAASVTSI